LDPECGVWHTKPTSCTGSRSFHSSRDWFGFRSAGSQSPTV
jgi:hypothetical protein